MHGNLTHCRSADKYEIKAIKRNQLCNFNLCLIWKLIYCSNINQKGLFNIHYEQMIESNCGAFCGASFILSFSSHHKFRLRPQNSYRTSCNINFNILWTWMMIDDIFSHTCLASCPTFKPRDLYCEIMIELRCSHIHFYFVLKQ